MAEQLKEDSHSVTIGRTSGGLTREGESDNSTKVLNPDSVECMDCKWQGIKSQMSSDSLCPECGSDDVWDVNALYKNKKEEST